MIALFKNNNIYSDVAPFQETAVIIKDRHELAKLDHTVVPFNETAVIIKDGRTRDEMLAKLEERNYINASYIKSAFKENREDPFGLIIATQGP